MRNWPNAVLMLDQRLRRWPTSNKRVCRVGWESSYCQYAEVNCFQIPKVTQPFVSQHKAHMREMVNYFLIDVAQAYRVYMTWELALNAAMGMKRM